MREGESLSIENQKLILRKYADEHGFFDCKFYVDDGYSGASTERPAYKKMMNDIENERISTVFVKDQSRLGRDYLQTGLLMEITFPQYDVRFIAVNYGVDSINGVNDFARIKNYFNDSYACDTSKKIRAVQRAKGERGERVGIAIPYGYMKDSVNQKQIVPDPETPPIVRRIFEAYASGIGIVKICDGLTNDKIVSPEVYAFQRDGNRSSNPDMDRPYHWAQTTVRKMLSNQAYCGDTVNFKTFSKSNKLKKRIKNALENVLIFPDTHEAIIDRKTFDLVQKHFEGRKRPDKQGEIDKYAGILYCGECGSRLYLHRAKTMKPELNNFMCGGYQSRKTDCTSHYIRESVLDKIVLENLKEMTAYARENADKFYEMAAQNDRAEARKFSKFSQQERKQIETRIAQIDNTIRCLYEDRVVGRITPERYDQLAAGYESEQTELREKLTRLDKKAAELDLQEQYIRKFIEQAKTYIEMSKLTAELLRVFIRRIEVFEKPEKYSRTCGNTIIIRYTFECDEAFLATELGKSA